MNPSRIGTPINKMIDEWYFHFNGKSVRFSIYMKRPRDTERRSTEDGLLKLATFHAYLDRKYLKEQGIAETDLGFPTTPVSGDDYNEVFERVKNTVWSSKDQMWEKVIAIATAGPSRTTDHEKVKFAWGIGLRSKDGTLFKTLDSRNYVSRRPGEIIPGHGLYEDGCVVVHPYSEEMEAALKNLDAMFSKFTGALKFVISSPDVLRDIKSRLLPLTCEEQPAKPVAGQLTVNGIAL